MYPDRDVWEPNNEIAFTKLLEWTITETLEISLYLYQYLIKLMQKTLFYNRFYFMPLNVSSTPIGVMIPEAV